MCDGARLRLNDKPALITPGHRETLPEAGCSFRPRNKFTLFGPDVAWIRYYKRVAQSPYDTLHGLDG